jgi:hypothetical protein
VYDFLLDAISTIIKHGKSWGTVAGLVFLFLKQRAIKRAILKRLPRMLRRFQDAESDRLERIEAGLNRMETKIDALLKHSGVESWQSASSYNRSKNLAARNKTSSISPWAASTTARTVTQYTNWITRRIRIMKAKLTSRKFWLAVVSAILVVLNEGLDLGISNETVLAFAGIVITWILGETAVDVKRIKQNDGSDQYH